MTSDDIIRLALEHFGAVLKPSDLEVQLAVLAVAAEREACAKVTEDIDIVEFEHCMVLHQDAAKTLTNAAAAIRARGEV